MLLSSVLVVVVAAAAVIIIIITIIIYLRAGYLPSFWGIIVLQLSCIYYLYYM
jgi:hypothetical protein